ncbi:inhibitor of growth protein 2 isoform X2 [Syngnathoides biaculeatus]|uniref:inhibitor of growth protein 2 isoform X2 n=1 Tax=Syngnathoides biaculeatus TaxID=300417 RepID=UPI002ADD4500|nr:inhibitor of growth protein 2 isoform X2 [Syngnathoides biaculeatus]
MPALLLQPSHVGVCSRTLPAIFPKSEVLKEVDEVFEKYKAEQDSGQRKRLQVQLQRALIISQELGDEKIHVVTQMTELVENRSRQMDSHSLCLQEPCHPERVAPERRTNVQEPPAAAAAVATPASAERASGRRPRRQRNSESRDSSHPSANGSVADDAVEEPPAPLPREKKSKSTKKKKRKSKQERDASPVDFAIDPNEPTYCLCEQVSYGEMIGCDNDQCPIEWFHFSCVGLTYKPKGKWYCPKCRGDNEKTMDKSLDKNRKDRRSR